MAESRRILIIDDDSGIGEMLNLLLEYNGYEVIVSEKPDEAEELILNKKIDLLILDMLISGVNGTDVCKRLRANENADISGIPILMMSALHDAVSECKKAGANDFIAKPFEMDQLMNQIQRLLKN